MLSSLSTVWQGDWPAGLCIADCRHRRPLLPCRILVSCTQVIRLCEGACLDSALTYIYNQMADYRKPLLDLLARVAAASGSSSRAAAVAAAYKLLVYLRCCFRGLSFPPGTGSLPECVLAAGA